MKLSTIKAPALYEGKIVDIDVSGYAVNLEFEDGILKCFVQLNAEGKPEFLTHCTTGFKFPRTFANQGVTDFFRNGMIIKKGMRATAQAILDHLANAYGAKKIREAIAKQTIINH